MNEQEPRISWFAWIKHKLLGRPIHNKLAHHETLIVLFALPVFASDALSSTAYASEEILKKLQEGGSEYMDYLIYIAIALVALLWTVIFSYYQTIKAYPQGGGTYRVSSQNLGQTFGLVAGASLLIGYILTVAVSISASTSAVVAMAPATKPYVVLMAIFAISVMSILNLRGAKESGIVFAIPTYAFVILIGTIVGGAVWGWLGGGVDKQAFALDAAVTSQYATPITGLALIFFIFKAFSAGCAALTGTEAIADGVLAFREPKAVNANRTLILMGVILSVLFFGLSWSAYHYAITPIPFDNPEYKTVVAQIAAEIFGTASIGFYATQAATALILVLAANTAYADFPRLSMFIARDGFLPRQLMSLGDRLVYQNGILLLAISAIMLIVAFNANTGALLPMYAICVFLSFTMSQAGMVAWWKRHHPTNLKRYISLVGAIVTGSVVLVTFSTRFSEGSWISILAISLALVMFIGVKRHYDWLDRQLDVPDILTVPQSETTVLLLVPKMHRGILQGIAYSKSLAKDVRAVHVTVDPTSAEEVKRQWMQVAPDIPLVILESPFRSLVDPIIEYVDETRAEVTDPNHMITVIVPQAIPKNWLQGFLHSNVANYLKRALGTRKGVVVTNVRYFLD